MGTAIRNLEDVRRAKPRTDTKFRVHTLESSDDSNIRTLREAGLGSLLILLILVATLVASGERQTLDVRATANPEANPVIPNAPRSWKDEIEVYPEEAHASRVSSRPLRKLQRLHENLPEPPPPTAANEEEDPEAPSPGAENTARFGATGATGATGANGANGAEPGQEQPSTTKRAPGRLVITTTPKGALVQVDGQTLGRTPLDVEAPAGVDTISVQILMVGHVPFKGTMVRNRANGFKLDTTLQKRRR